MPPKCGNIVRTEQYYPCVQRGLSYVQSGLSPMDEDDSMVRKLVGRRIGAMRHVRHLSLRQLADLLGWPQQTLVNYEYGRRPLTVERIVALAHALGCAPASLLVDNDDMAAVIDRMDHDPALSAHIVRLLKGAAPQHDLGADAAVVPH